ncbi:MAG TPA: copper-binding protein [Opitutaceae bacterium]|nr:copper-binding protein [Opitutaceae bacterium]
MARSLSITSIPLYLTALAPCIANPHVDYAAASDFTGSPSCVRMSADKVEIPVRHPIKGVIVGVRTDKQALLVKHEEIPGVMRAMTMLLKTDPTTLQRVAKGQKITGLLLRKDDGWWIESVTVIP